MSNDRGRAPYLPFDGGRFRIAMGLLPLKPEDWLETDESFTADLAAKQALLASRHDDAFAALPAAKAPARELLALLGEHLPRHHPALFRRDGDRLHNLATGESWDVAQPPLHPLDLAGRLVQEDLCLLVAEDGSPVLAGASLCSPARWRLAEKIGRPLSAIHDPVPGYAEQLARPVDRFFALMKPGKLVWRLNWGILDDPTPFQPVRPGNSRTITPGNAGEALWLRVERQTLRRLDETGAVVFTIRTHITRLDAAIRENRAAAELAATLREMPEASRRYKHLAGVAPALLAWLDARSSGGASP
jgi:dimethylamine monooxygenase subunit A